MSGGDRKPDGPAILSGEGGTPEPDDFSPDPPATLDLDARVRLLPGKWQGAARDLVASCLDRGLGAGETYAELARWDLARREFSPDREHSGGRSTEAPERWCDAILRVVTPEHQGAFEKATERAWVAASQGLRNERITDPAFAHLEGTPWVGRTRGNGREAPLIRNIRVAVRRRWKEKPQ